MPFSQTTKVRTKRYWTEHFEKFLKPLIKECRGVSAYRSKPLRENLLGKIIFELVRCPIVVADLTDLNANVFWELGVRQSFKRGTVTIAEDGTKIPSDVLIKGILWYHTKAGTYIKNEEFRRDFKEAINDCLSNPNKSDSYVLETISGRGSLFEIIRLEEVNRRISAIEHEILLNKTVEKQLNEIIKYNQKNPENRGVVTARFQYCALESLVVNRYLDENNKFYMTALELLTHLRARNCQLNLWSIEPSNIESWFMDKRVIEDFKNFIKAFEKQIITAKIRLSKSC